MKAFICKSKSTLHNNFFSNRLIRTQFHVNNRESGVQQFLAFQSNHKTRSKYISHNRYYVVANAPSSTHEKRLWSNLLHIALLRWQKNAKRRMIEVRERSYSGLKPIDRANRRQSIDFVDGGAGARGCTESILKNDRPLCSLGPFSFQGLVPRSRGGFAGSRAANTVHGSTIRLTGARHRVRELCSAASRRSSHVSWRGRHAHRPIGLLGRLGSALVPLNGGGDELNARGAV